MNSIFIALLALASGPLQSASEWAPTFDDQPVADELALAVHNALPDSPIVAVDEERRILIFSATSGYRHTSIPVGKLALTEVGKATGAYETVVSDDPLNFELETLKGFDTVVLLNTTMDFFMPNKKHMADFSEDEWAWLQARHERLVDNLIQYVNGGGGLVGIHSATDSCYNHKAYGDVMGGYFAGHPWTSGMEVTIVVEDGEHALVKPVFEGIKDFRIKEEIYQFSEEPYSRDKLRVLLHLDPERSDTPKTTPAREDGDYAVSWVQSVGAGRVFYTSLGHRHDIFTNPLILRHYLAGIQFATGDLEADTTPSSNVSLPSFEK